jgi:cell division protein FtsZ
MSINLSVPESSTNQELKPRITVIGVGGAGGNAVNNMIRRELDGVDFVVANTDAQALLQSGAERRIQLGATLTEGLGAGSNPEVGAAAAEEAHEEVLHQLNGAHMAFIAAGMGGGTGTGAAPVIAKSAKEAGILTVAVVTKPFQFEGTHRMRLAEAGIEELAQYVDTLIIIPNQNLFRVATENTTFADAFSMADEVLYSGVRGVTDLMVMPGLINLDFADIRSVMSEMGKAMMGTGEAEGERRALEAAEAAIANPLLDDTSMKGAKGVLINITGGSDITLFEVDEAASRIRAEVDQDAYIIIGSAFDGELNGKMRVSVVATGIDSVASVMPQPTMMRVTEAISRVRPAPLPVETEDAASTEMPEEVEIKEEPVEEIAEVVLESNDQPNTEPVIEETEAEEVGISESTDSEIVVAEVKPEAPNAPAAMPRIGGEDAFIPPMPKDPEAKTIENKPDPFAAAAMTNGAQEAAKAPDADEPVRPSLFERVTRTGRAAFGRDAADAPAKATAVASQPVEIKQEPSMPAASAAIPEPIAVIPAKPAFAAVAEAVQPELEQAQMVDLAPVDEKAVDEDDLLDIPAFLRRQAN